MLANIVEKWCLRGWYKNQKIPDLCGGAEQLPKKASFVSSFHHGRWKRGSCRSNYRLFSKRYIYI
ncbi:hypothetical protein [Endozoicomonas sp. SCSIO W0465]|uniref:hypothetical protein n=1 Tax=Endozoicomonas sp. SCSIO W0465 TaxID=2918516 RepID=UPI0020763051|nr:hypothetical protein [Endozoicomonas sp. SCSIO W0465]USE38179.1 hypothetical protein MJO57_08440 [Endozoicomonas sp. SCSIO W0465]